MTGRIVAAVSVGGPSYVWRIPVAGVLIVFYLACLAADAVQTWWRQMTGGQHHG